MKSVFSAVRTGSLNKAVCASALKDQSKYRTSTLQDEPVSLLREYHVTGKNQHEEFWFQMASGGLCVSWSICLYTSPCFISLFIIPLTMPSLPQGRIRRWMNNELEKMWKEIAVS